MNNEHNPMEIRMNMPRYLASLLAIVCLVVLSPTTSLTTSVFADHHESTEDGFKPLWNGKDFTGWYTYLQKYGRNYDPENIITIEDGVIHLYKHAEHGSHPPMGYIGTEKEYENYHLRFQYKWGEKKFKPRFEILQDAGLYYHMVGPDRVWPQALQFQIERTNVGDIVTVGHIRYETTIDPKTADEKDTKPTYRSEDEGGIEHTHGMKSITHLARADLFEQEGWNTCEIVTKGEQAEHRLNGHVVARLKNARRPKPENSDDFVPLNKGRILLEIEAAEIFFRNVEIKLSARRD
ncbi:MAG: DUF1080 domain-containing protein [Pirellulales bacterium]